MDVEEALRAADDHEQHGPHMHSEQVGIVLAAEVRRWRTKWHETNEAYCKRAQELADEIERLKSQTR